MWPSHAKSQRAVNESIDAFDGHLLETSPAVDLGTVESAPSDDLEGRPRDAQPDVGAYERWEPTAWVYLTAVAKGPSAAILPAGVPN